MLAPGKRTRGQVLGANGAPLPSVYVAAKDERGNSLTAVLTDSNGRFELLLDPEREHELEARPPAKPGEREDLKQAPDPATFAVLTPGEADERRGRLCCSVQRRDGLPFDGDPRSALERVIERAAGARIDYRVGIEMEYYLLKGDWTHLAVERIDSS